MSCTYTMHNPLQSHSHSITTYSSQNISLSTELQVHRTAGKNHSLNDEICSALGLTEATAKKTFNAHSFVVVLSSEK